VITLSKQVPVLLATLRHLCLLARDMPLKLCLRVGLEI
jgi:hypothetical protein